MIGWDLFVRAGRVVVLDWIESVSQPIAEFVNGTLGPAADFLNDYVWGWPTAAPLLAVVLLGTGLFVTIRLAADPASGLPPCDRHHARRL